jgi:hypothetical protein
MIASGEEEGEQEVEAKEIQTRGRDRGLDGNCPVISIIVYNSPCGTK